MSEVFSHPENTNVAQAFIESTLHLDVPEDYLARLKPEPAEGLGPLLKLEFELELSLSMPLDLGCITQVQY